MICKWTNYNLIFNFSVLPKLKAWNSYFDSFTSIAGIIIILIYMLVLVIILIVCAKNCDSLWIELMLRFWFWIIIILFKTIVLKSTYYRIYTESYRGNRVWRVPANILPGEGVAKYFVECGIMIFVKNSCSHRTFFTGPNQTIFGPTRCLQPIRMKREI